MFGRHALVATLAACTCLVIAAPANAQTATGSRGPNSKTFGAFQCYTWLYLRLPTNVTDTRSEYRYSEATFRCKSASTTAAILMRYQTVVERRKSLTDPKETTQTVGLSTAAYKVFDRVNEYAYATTPLVTLTCKYYYRAYSRLSYSA